MLASRRAVDEARVSVVVPVFNEEAVLPELRNRLTGVLQSLKSEFEVVFVDDGSVDGTARLLERFHQEDPRFKCVRFSRNFGHQAAVSAGLRYSSGDVTCVMDADLQDPPEVIRALLAEWAKGSDVVYAVRRKRKEAPVKVGLYNLFYRLLAHFSSIPIPLDAGDFCLLSRPVRDELNRLPEKERFVRGLRAWVGFKQMGVEYERDARRAGDSKYSLVALGRLAMNGIVSFSDKPLIYLTAFGLLVAAVAFLYGGYLVGLRLLFGNVITGYSSLMSGLLFLGGVQIFAVGVLGIYLSKIFVEVKARPTYIVSELLGVGDNSPEMEVRAGPGGSRSP